ncbi:hypothetical protein OIDMADRAFT_173067 [Oidiodendron maius Zn]|uniref:Amino acid permease/ SLC12A domain-containing protein n=1 Tax=Oidiodendron maius (strain Zn) TaxID=913774 RepID=A0A0C3CVH7_OIDMZ|nr:hypothetical protein OIDMADRAFT_173067 [Oidiodendron maius Zn]
MGIVMSAVVSSLGEMTALMPVNAPMMEFPRRFLDRGVGFAIGWLFWHVPHITTIQTAVTTADELTAVTQAIRFKYDDGRTYLAWTVGDSVDPAFWMTLFLILIIIANMLPVKYFGELDYIFGCIKIVFIITLIIMMLVLATMTPRTNAYYDQILGVTYWNSPYSFFNPGYSVVDENGDVQRVITGSMGRFLGEWKGIIKAAFSYTGMDIFAATARESKALGDAESMKMAARKITLRIITLYCFAIITGSLVVPYNHPFLNGKAQSVGASSIFVIAVVEGGLPRLAHFFNAIFILSAFSCAANFLFLSSRVLYTLALLGQTGPEWITRRLQQCHWGVPTGAVIFSALMTLLGYMGRTGSPGERLDQIDTTLSVSYLIIYAIITAAYLKFYYLLEDVKTRESMSEAQATCYDRNHPRYPYKSHGQWLRASSGMAACIILFVFSGVFPFLVEPFDYQNFLVSYISGPIFVLLVVGYKIHRHGFRISKWGPERSCDLSGCVQATGEKRKGRLVFPDKGITRENTTAFIEWIWVWVK